jgi:protein-S-isoprenylcysteine O-methyltransferase Ste14
MNASAGKPDVPGTLSDEIRAGILRRVIQVILATLIQAALLFVSAGRFDWALGWGFIGLNAAGAIVIASVVYRLDPSLIAERGRSSGGTKGWDKILGTFVGLPAMLAVPIVAGLDLRFAWSSPSPLWVHLGGIAVWIFGYGLITWAMGSNRYFSTAVRIQTDRDHQVQRGGPYRFLRHPGYLGTIVALAATPVLLGRWWTLVPAAVLVAVLLIRTALEDRMLLAELPGYQDYAMAVRCRLIPGIW